MRILITGSRNWADWEALIEAIVWHGGHEHSTLVHGACPTGADAMVTEFFGLDDGWTVEEHPADWSLGRKAGPLRNQAMVDLGADLCLAFPLGESRGTRDCMRRAETAGIRVVVVQP